MKKHIKLICCTIITALTFCACDTNSDTGIEYLNSETLTSSGVTDISAINATETKTAETDTKPRTTYTEIIADTPKTNETEADETTVKETEVSNNSSPALKPTNTPRATNTPAPMPTNATPTPKPTETARSTSAPTPQATSTPMPTATPSPKPTATSTPKPTNIPTPTATPTPEPHEHDWVRYPYMQSWDDNLGYIYYCECGEDYYEYCYSPSDPDRESVAAIVRVPTDVYGCNITSGYGTAWEDGDAVTVLVVREYIVQPKEGAYYHDPCIDDYEWYEIYEDPDDLYEGLYEVYPNAVAWGYGTACIDENLVGPELIGFVDEPVNYYPWY